MTDKFKVIRTDFNHLENWLNDLCKLYPHYHIYQILPEHSYDGAFAIIILELDEEEQFI